MAIGGLAATCSHVNVIRLLILNLGCFGILLRIWSICTGFSLVAMTLGAPCDFGLFIVGTHFDPLVFHIIFCNKLNKNSNRQFNTTTLTECTTRSLLSSLFTHLSIVKLLRFPFLGTLFPNRGASGPGLGLGLGLHQSGWTTKSP